MTRTAESGRTRPAFWWPLAITVVLSLFFRFTEADFWIADPFYSEASGLFHPKREGIGGLFYVWGPKPALAVAIAGLVVVAAAFIRPLARAYWRPALFLSLAMIMGPGVVVNSIFKDHFGRPRPRHIERYGGSLEYHKLFQPGNDRGSHGDKIGVSFPSGHASMGFYWFAGYFIFFRRKPKIARTFIRLGLGMGILIGLARIMQGGHWASDVLWSGVFCYFVSYGLYFALRPDRYGPETLQAERHDHD